MTRSPSPPPSPQDPITTPATTGRPAGDDVLAMVEHFRRVALPAFLRRMHQWNGLDPDRDPGVVDELLHTLTVDCLEHPELIRDMTPPARHQRWLQLAERSLYQTRFRHRRRQDPATEPDERPAPEGAGDPDGGAMQATLQGLPGDQGAFARELLQVAEHFNNGRLHLEATARRMGMRVPRLRQRWTRLTSALGVDDTAYRDLSHRLALALTGLASDLLRDQGLVRVWSQPRRHRPDPDSRVRTVQRLRERMAVRPLDPAARRAVQIARNAVAVHRQHGDVLGAVGELLRCALELAPRDRSVVMWTVEAHLAAGAFPEALAMLRRARALGCDPVAEVLARARTLELRHRPAAAARLLIRARRKLGPRPRAAVERSLQHLRDDSPAS